jgi:amidohydrolase
MVLMRLFVLIFGWSQLLVAEERDAVFAKEVDAMQAVLVDIRRDLHAHPELPNQETRTAKFVADKLRALGLTEIREGVARTGVVAMLHGEHRGPCVAIRADMDALPIKELRSVPYRSKNPGVMHACGHDVHTTVALGVAQLLAKHRQHVRGSIKFLFQPAEEAMPATYKEDWGAKLMIAEGAMENPKPVAVFGLHCSTGISFKHTGEGQPDILEVGDLGWAIGADSAQSDRFSIVIKGSMAHGSSPHRGVDAIAVAAECITSLQLIRSRETNTTQPLVLSIGTIQGGQRENIIADRVELGGTVRTHDVSLRDKVLHLMHRTLKGVTSAHGASYELDYRSGYPPVMNDRQLVLDSLPSLERIVGKAHLFESRPSLGGEDFSYFAQVCPGFYFRLGVANEERGITAGAHTPDFDVDEDCLAVGVKAMAALLCDGLEKRR